MPRRLALALLACAAALASSASPAAAFWPFTRGEVLVAPDTLTADRLQKRLEVWKDRPLHPEVIDSTTAAAQNTMRTLGGQTPGTTLVISAAGSRGGAPPPSGATAGPGSSTPPSSADSSAAASPPPPASAATQDSTALAAADSSGAAAGDSTAGGLSQAERMAKAREAAASAAPPDSGFVPKLSVTLNSSNDAMRMNSSLSTGFIDPSGISLTAGITYADDISLTQKTDQKTKSLTNSITFPLRAQGLDLVLTSGNNKLDRVGARTITGQRTRNSNEDRSAQVTAQLSRKLDSWPMPGSLQGAVHGVGVNSFFSRNFSQNDQNIIATAGSAEGSRNHDGAGNSWGAGVSFNRFKWLGLRAHVGTSRIGNKDQSPGLVREGNPDGTNESTTEGDTASVDVDMPLGWGFLPKVTMAFRVSHGSDSFTDNARSASGSQTGQLGNFVLETKSSYNRSLNLDTSPKPMRLLRKVLPWTGADSALGWVDRRLQVHLTMDVSRDSTGYRVRPNQFSDTKRFNWKLDSNLEYRTGSKITVRYESSRNDANQDEPRNPRNPLTRLDKDHKLYGEVYHVFPVSIKARLYGEIRLTQGFYRNPGPEGLGDRDELRTQLGLDLDGNIGPNVTARVQTYLRAYDQAFIDRRSSSKSKNEREYVVRPSFTWKISERATVAQSYGLASKVLDEIFDPTRNTLNRNHFMNTSFDYRLTPRLGMNAGYDYLLQDNGLYTADPGSAVRLFAPQSRTKKDGIGLGMSYEVLKDGKLSFVSRQESTRERRTTDFTGNKPAVVTERGNLALGLDSKLSMGELKLYCRLRRNQSFNVSLNRSVYYNADATLSYTF